MQSELRRIFMSRRTITPVTAYQHATFPDDIIIISPKPTRLLSTGTRIRIRFPIIHNGFSVPARIGSIIGVDHGYTVLRLYHNNPDLHFRFVMIPTDWLQLGIIGTIRYHYFFRQSLPFSLVLEEPQDTLPLNDTQSESYSPPNNRLLPPQRLRNAISAEPVLGER